MFPLLRRATERHYIHEGRVYCPVRGRDVEFDLCAGCAQVREIQPDVEFPYVRCQPGSVIGWAPRPF